MTGRTVIGPDPTLRMGQLAVPPQMADILTIPVQVNNFNYDYWQILAAKFIFVCCFEVRFHSSINTLNVNTNIF